MINVVHYSQTYNEALRLTSVNSIRLNVARSWIWICGEIEIEKHSALYETILQTASTNVFADLMNTVRLYIYTALLLFSCHCARFAVLEHCTFSIYILILSVAFSLIWLLLMYPPSILVCVYVHT